MEIISKEVGMVSDELIGNLGDVHLYSNHTEQAKEQIDREPFKKLPTLKFSPIPSAHFEHHIDSFEDYIKEFSNFSIVIDKESQPYFENATLDFMKVGLTEQFKIINPLEETQCGCGISGGFKKEL